MHTLPRVWCIFSLSAHPTRRDDASQKKSPAICFNMGGHLFCTPNSYICGTLSIPHPRRSDVIFTYATIALHFPICCSISVQ